MKLLNLLLLALVAVLPLSCKGTGGGTSSSEIRSERIALKGADSLTAEIIRGEWNENKLWLQVVFQNNGTETVSFQLSQVFVDVDGTRLPAKPFLSSLENDIDLLPSQVKTKKYGFHHRDLGIAGPTPGRHELIVGGVRGGGMEGMELVVPFEVK